MLLLSRTRKTLAFDEHHASAFFPLAQQTSIEQQPRGSTVPIDKRVYTNKLRVKSCCELDWRSVGGARLDFLTEPSMKAGTEFG
jgi:hypothetical protein